MPLYEYKCSKHGKFEINEPMLSEHKANCPQCGTKAQRVFTCPEWIWAGSLYREDGSRREQNDYAGLKG